MNAGWALPVLERWPVAGRGGAIAVVFPSYRPDLARQLAAILKAGFRDFRQSRMAPLGWDASKLPVSALDEAIAAEMASGRDIVFHNAEALLSLQGAESRQAWFKSVLSRPWPHRIALTLALYPRDLPPGETTRIAPLDAETLPAETILDRLSTLQ